ncbi:hypothetical protein [Chromobacterium phragmitis]|uniref:Uncharacterized protein n=1 Tax=Chromobacterium phragmitis TaxID=2202141 RepID=A0A344UPJ4_9NEIS|nr:hypothetical protein [Chromobacterium phragmitis]AXE37131.1 hypothetical protein DK843_22535 [Chromobacterium phragmitis]AXE37192.1 hypothetical protein DK843_22855 [Chromobacterium phragmitis]
MTAIAFDGKTMAADGRSTADDIIITDEAVKLHRIETNRWSQRPAIVGLSGKATAGSAVLSWLRGEGHPDASRDWCALIWDGETARTVTADCLTPEIWPGPIAIGSGKLPALAAMRAGADAEKAVAVAITMDVYCGGQIHTMQLDVSEQVPHPTPATHPHGQRTASTFFGDVTSADINRAMQTCEYHDSWGITYCRITLFNRYVVTGTSSSGHNDDLKRKQALKDAEQQVKQLLDFLLHSQHAAVETGGWQLDNGPRQRGHYDLAQLVANTHPNHFQPV